MYQRYINGVTKQLATGGKKAWFIMLDLALPRLSDLDSSLFLDFPHVNSHRSEKQTTCSRLVGPFFFGNHGFSIAMLIYRRVVLKCMA